MLSLSVLESQPSLSHSFLTHMFRSLLKRESPFRSKRWKPQSSSHPMVGFIYSPEPVVSPLALEQGCFWPAELSECLPGRSPRFGGHLSSAFLLSQKQDHSLSGHIFLAAEKLITRKLRMCGVVGRPESVLEGGSIVGCWKGTLEVGCKNRWWFQRFPYPGYHPSPLVMTYFYRDCS